MSELFPDELRYTKSHEWLRDEGDGLLRMGITSHAQSELRDVVFVELPEVGRAAQQGEAVAVVESVKAAFDIYAPLTGTVDAVNQAIEADPSLINQAPYGEGWFLTLTAEDTAELDNLMDATSYQSYLELGEPNHSDA